MKRVTITKREFQILRKWALTGVQWELGYVEGFGMSDKVLLLEKLNAKLKLIGKRK